MGEAKEEEKMERREVGGRKAGRRVDKMHGEEAEENMPCYLVAHFKVDLRFFKHAANMH